MRRTCAVRTHDPRPVEQSIPPGQAACSEAQKRQKLVAKERKVLTQAFAQTPSSSDRSSHVCSLSISVTFRDLEGQRTYDFGRSGSRA